MEYLQGYQWSLQGYQWSPQEDEMIAEANALGLSDREIFENYFPSLTHGKVQHRRAKLGLKKVAKDIGFAHWPIERIETIKKLVEEDKSMEEVGLIIGFSSATIRAAARHFGFERPKSKAYIEAAKNRIQVSNGAIANFPRVTTHMPFSAEWWIDMKCRAGILHLRDLKKAYPDREYGVYRSAQTDHPTYMPLTSDMHVSPCGSPAAACAY
jgi:hypothetical protein